MALYKIKDYSIMIWLTSWTDYHTKFSEQLSYRYKIEEETNFSF